MLRHTHLQRRWKTQEENFGEGIIGKVEHAEDVNQIKKLVLKAVEGEPNFGLKYENDLDKILLVDKETFEKVARKSGSMYFEDVNRYKNVRRPLTVYFSPFRSASTGKVRSKHVLVIDVDDKVVEDWDDPSGRVIRWTHRPLTNARAFKLVKEFLAMNGISIMKRDRIYRLNP